jgi:hypothetical protein
MLGQHEVAKCLPVIELGDGMPDDPLDGAQEVLWLRQALAASTEQLVRTLHPTWDDLQVNAEVDRIQEEKTLAVGGDVATGRYSPDPEDKAGSGAERNAPIV